MPNISVLTGQILETDFALNSLLKPSIYSLSQISHCSAIPQLFFKCNETVVKRISCFFRMNFAIRRVRVDVRTYD
jgi:hypothetical protein